MIQPNKIDVQVFEHFDPQDKSLGFLNDYENLDLRAQIAKAKMSGYYLMFKGEKIMIQPNGKISPLNWVEGLYDMQERLLCELFKAQRDKSLQNCWYYTENECQCVNTCEKKNDQAS
jgi:hypothetical protein